MAEKLREAYINIIMQNQYNDDDPKYDGNNRDFLETLSLDELRELSVEALDEDEL